MSDTTAYYVLRRIRAALAAEECSGIRRGHLPRGLEGVAAELYGRVLLALRAQA